MKKLFLISSFLLLSACGEPTLVLDVEYFTDEPELLDILETATENVIERMAFAIENQVPDIEVKNKGDKLRFTVGLMHKATADQLAESLARPLDVVFALQAEEGDTPDITNENYGDFVKTDLAGEHIQWVSAEGLESEDSGEANVAISLKEDGSKIWSDIVESNAGRKTGLFVRGGLVSLTTVKEGGTGSTIYISGIPSFTLARIFSEDIVVGTYAKFKVVK